MAMKKSIGRTLAHIDVAANTSVRIHEDFFNSHPLFSTVINSASAESVVRNLQKLDRISASDARFRV
jgi:hypothetical protein